MTKERCSISRFARRMNRVSKKFPSYPFYIIEEKATNGGLGKVRLG